MKLRPRIMTSLGVRLVIRRLQRLPAGQDNVIDSERVGRELRDLIAGMAPEHIDEEIYAAIDQYVDSYVSQFRREMYERYNSDLIELDLLETRLRPYLEWADEVNSDERSRVEHMNGAVTHALDRVSDPDQPYRDPIRPNHNRGTT
ncbi:hypothetical protein [Dactylosporangium sp. CA-139066]|uniref:hypothetical protein n=1 Tax=Dactylosporangium sp. CA-139066 TaxID=3239930 RepID=UPI003D93C96E